MRTSFGGGGPSPPALAVRDAATVRSLVLESWEASRRTVQASSEVMAWVAMRMPRAWSITGREVIA